jgi:hypothetical protein
MQEYPKRRIRQRSDAGPLPHRHTPSNRTRTLDPPVKHRQEGETMSPQSAHAELLMRLFGGKVIETPRTLMVAYEGPPGMLLWWITQQRADEDGWNEITYTDVQRDLGFRPDDFAGCLAALAQNGVLKQRQPGGDLVEVWIDAEKLNTDILAVPPYEDPGPPEGWYPEEDEEEGR